VYKHILFMARLEHSPNRRWSSFIHPSIRRQESYKSISLRSGSPSGRRRSKCGGWSSSEEGTLRAAAAISSWSPSELSSNDGDGMDSLAVFWSDVSSLVPMKRMKKRWLSTSSSLDAASFEGTVLDWWRKERKERQKDE
jgi:hypothetical protein